MTDLPDYERGPVRDANIREMDAEQVLEQFALASLKRVMADTNTEERAWEEYWFDLHSDIVSRMLG